MVVKDKVGRYRYIVFRVEATGHTSKRGLEEAIRRSFTPVRAANTDPRLVSFDGEWGILRCSHRHKDEAVVALRSISSVSGKAVCVTTTGTSGTIRRARRKYLP